MSTHSDILVREEQALRGSLLANLDSLYRRRACEIPEGYIDRYVALDWLQWHGGSLRLTTTGENVRRQLTQETR